MRRMLLILSTRRHRSIVKVRVFSSRSGFLLISQAMAFLACELFENSGVMELFGGSQRVFPAVSVAKHNINIVILLALELVHVCLC